MATISPFRAWRYAPDRVRVQDVVTQPYDKIKPARQESYYAASPFNLVRIILGKRLASDTQSENVYTRAAASFHDWRAQGILKQDAEPSLYRYLQSFKVPGSNKVAERRGFIGLGRIEDYSAGVVYRHEQTLAKPKADRLDLLRATRGHFGQIFMLYSGAGEVDAALNSLCEGAPDIEVTDEYDVAHRVWAVNDPGVIGAIQGRMRDQKLIIADGHHRYETSLVYRNECRQRDGETRGNEAGNEKTSGSGAVAPHDYTMMTFVDMDCPGLVILPTHRAVFGIAPEKVKSFSEEARRFFNVEEIDAGIDRARATEILKQAGMAGTALLAVAREQAFLLHTPRTIGTQLFGDLSLRQQALDVVQLHKCLLESCLTISEEALRNQQNVAYFREADEALAQVRGGEMQMAFLMNPVRIQQMQDIALAGEVMPQKSTDFYPKLLSGLAIYALD